MTILTNEELAFIMEQMTENKKLPGFYRRFWWAMEKVFGIDKQSLQNAVSRAKREGMYKRGRRDA